MSAVLYEEARNGLPTVLLLTVVVALAAALTRAEQGRVAALRERAASLEREQDAVRRKPRSRSGCVSRAIFTMSWVTG